LPSPILLDLAGTVGGNDLSRTPIHINKHTKQVAPPPKLKPRVHDLATGPHNKALLGIGKNLADHRLVEVAPSKLQDRVRRQHEVQDGMSLAFHNNDYGMASTG